MSRRRHLFALGLAAASAALGGALAQDSSEGIDLEAIRARAGQHASEADALASAARQRASTLATEAFTTAQAGEANGRRYSVEARRTAKPTNAPFDFDAMVAGAGDSALAQMGDAPRFIAFASTAMPPASLKSMIHDVTRAGGVVVFRGLPQGNARAMLAALSRVLKRGESLEGVGIDPRLFRAFQVDAVPSYVVASSDFELCDGFSCTSQVPPHDRLSGNVTAEFALRTFAEGGGPGAQIAAQHLARLEEQRP